MTNLSNILSTVNGASFISLDTSTIPTLTGGKGNTMQGRIMKHNTGASIMVFQNKNSHGYANMVSRRLETEGKETTFKLSPRKWGVRVPNMPIVEHKGAQYLEVIFLKTGKSTYTLDGKAIDKANIIGLKDNAPEGKQGGLNNKVIIRTFKLASVTRLGINGVDYTANDLEG